MRVLIVEDDRALALFLRKGLEMDGYEVAWAADGEDALNRIAESTPELLLLDLNLPRRDGTEVLEVVHRLYREASVLVLTGRSQVEERVRCLNLGADDCLVKPFSFQELTARCRALLRRRGQQADSVLRCGDVVLNRVERTVARAGRAVELTVKEFSLLEYLMQHRGQGVSRSLLLERVWHMSPEAGTNVVDVYINYLRRKLHDTRDQPLIETVRGVGYRLLETVRLDNGSADPMPEALLGMKAAEA
ncbi:MAG: response regulator transcription factor [Acidobacteriaceae bacterium]